MPDKLSMEKLVSQLKELNALLDRLRLSRSRLGLEYAALGNALENQQKSLVDAMHQQNRQDVLKYSDELAIIKQKITEADQKLNNLQFEINQTLSNVIEIETEIAKKKSEAMRLASLERTERLFSGEKNSRVLASAFASSLVPSDEERFIAEDSTHIDEEDEDFFIDEDDDNVVPTNATHTSSSSQPMQESLHSIDTVTASGLIDEKGLRAFTQASPNAGFVYSFPPAPLMTSSSSESSSLSLAHLSGQLGFHNGANSTSITTTSSSSLSLQQDPTSTSQTENRQINNSTTSETNEDSCSNEFR